eukprot:1293702-Rhodomonas_salina.1
MNETETGTETGTETETETETETQRDRETETHRPGRDTDTADTDTDTDLVEIVDERSLLGLHRQEVMEHRVRPCARPVTCPLVTCCSHVLWSRVVVTCGHVSCVMTCAVQARVWCGHVCGHVCYDQGFVVITCGGHARSRGMATCQMWSRGGHVLACDS